MLNQRRGFTLIELVVVILVLGILAAVAAPKLFDVSAKATENNVRHSLGVIRDAINLYSATHSGQLPGADANQITFKTDLSPHLRKFPQNPVGVDVAKSDHIKMEATGLPLSGEIGGQQGWLYDNVTGEFRANVNSLSSDGVTKYSELKCKSFYWYYHMRSQKNQNN